MKGGLFHVERSVIEQPDFCLEWYHPSEPPVALGLCAGLAADEKRLDDTLLVKDEHYPVPGTLMNRA